MVRLRRSVSVISTALRLCKNYKFCTDFLKQQIQLLTSCVLHVRNGGASMANFGYARVSTDGQTLDGQVAELIASGCSKVFREKISGACSDREQLAKALDVLDHWRSSRCNAIGSSSRDPLVIFYYNILATISKKGTESRSLRDTWADTDHTARPSHADGARRFSENLNAN